MGNVVTEFLTILVSGISTLGQGIATGVKDMAVALFLDTQGGTTKLSTLGNIMAIMAAIALAIGVTRLVFSWVTSLGN